MQYHESYIKLLTGFSLKVFPLKAESDIMDFIMLKYLNILQYFFIPSFMRNERKNSQIIKLKFFLIYNEWTGPHIKNMHEFFLHRNNHKTFLHLADNFGQTGPISLRGGKRLRQMLCLFILGFHTLNFIIEIIINVSDG